MQVTDADHRQRLVELTGSQERVAACGAFFVVCGDTRRHRLLCPRAGRLYHTRLEAFLLAVIDATLFAQNLALAFESMGYGICYIGGLRNKLGEVHRLLGFPLGVYPLYGLCVGVPAEAPSPCPRLPVGSVLFHDRYPDDEQVLWDLEAYDAAFESYLEQRGASPRPWTEIMTGKFAEPHRVDLGEYYRSQGADVS